MAKAMINMLYLISYACVAFHGVVHSCLETSTPHTTHNLFTCVRAKVYYIGVLVFVCV